MRKVEFLVAGVQKGGTTALFSYLEEHPGLNLAPVKEVHFFDDEETVDWRAPDYQRFHDQFRRQDDAPSGEATPIYIYWPNSLERIRAYNPAMKFILLFRDPIERAWSQWRMEYRRRAETEPFAWCIREGRERVRLNADPKGAHRVYSYVERGFYGAQLERFLQLFPRGQALMLRSEDLRCEPRTALGHVCRFLGVAEPATTVERRDVHVGAEAPDAMRMTAADREHLRDLFADDLRRFQRLSGLDTSAWMKEPS